MNIGGENIPSEGIKLFAISAIKGIFTIIACAPLLNFFGGDFLDDIPECSVTEGCVPLLRLAMDSFYFVILASVAVAGIYAFARAVQKRRYEQEQIQQQAMYNYGGGYFGK